MEPDATAPFRDRMVREQLEARGLRDPRILSTFRAVPRHRFVPEVPEASAYGDEPLPIGHGATISQPYIVAKMTELLRLGGTERVLEIGTGSGYQTAILAELAGAVFSIEIVPALHERAKAILDALGYRNVTLALGDGARGWPEQAPFDGILAGAAPEEAPPALLEQLGEGGRLVIPLGVERQHLYRFEKTGKGVRKTRSFEVRFVPLVGRHARPSRPGPPPPPPAPPGD